MGWQPTNGIMVLATLAMAPLQATTAAEMTALPELQLLEFIGQWETDQGEWLSPEQLMNGEFGQLLESAAAQSGQSGSADAADAQHHADSDGDPGSTGAGSADAGSTDEGPDND
jgi:hypothetical protein